MNYVEPALPPSLWEKSPLRPSRRRASEGVGATSGGGNLTTIFKQLGVIFRTVGRFSHCVGRQGNKSSSLCLSLGFTISCGRSSSSLGMGRAGGEEGGGGAVWVGRPLGYVVRLVVPLRRPRDRSSHLPHRISLRNDSGFLRCTVMRISHMASSLSSLKSSFRRDSSATCSCCASSHHRDGGPTPLVWKQP